MTTLRLHVQSAEPLAPPERRALAALLLRTGLSIELCAAKEAECALVLGASQATDRPAVALPLSCRGDGDPVWRSELWQLLTHLRGADEGATLEPFLSRAGKRATVSLDLVRLTRAALEGWDEERGERDEHGRPMPSASMAGKLELLHRPWLDEMAHALGDLLLAATGRRRELPGATWYFCATFDIDSAGMFASRRSTARGLLEILKRRGPIKCAEAVWRAARCAARVARDPHLQVREIAEALEGQEVHGTFLVQTHRAHRLDNYTLAQSRALRAELTVIERNRYHEIGLHSSYATRDRRSDFFRSQWRALQRHGTPRAARVHRAHYLRSPDHAAYPPPPGRRDWVDSSLAFGAQEGFRRGTAWPWRAQPGMIELAPCTMDSTLHHHRGLDPKGAFERQMELLRCVQRTGGAFVGVWHPHNLEEFLWPGWSDVLWDLVREAKKRGAICQSLARTAEGLQIRADTLERYLARTTS